MSDMTNGNPLMRPWTWDGETYLTSKKLHQDYQNNATERGEIPKHQRHPDYLALIRTIPNYNILIDRKDIFVADKKSIKTSNDVRKEILLSSLKLFFAANDNKRITFLNATAQMELTHHLDDLLNQETAYRHSREGATGTLADIWLQKHGFLKWEALYDFPLFFEFCRVWGVKLPKPRKEGGRGEHWPGCGNLMKQFIYGMFPVEVQERLDQINAPAGEAKLRPRRQHQHFLEKRRWDTLKAREAQVLSLLRLCDDGEKETFLSLLERHDRRLGLEVQVSKTIRVRLSTVATNQLFLGDDGNGNNPFFEATA